MENVSMTKTAAAYFHKTLQRKNGALGIRLGIKKAGCSGQAYTLDVATDIKEEELQFESEGIKLVIHPNSLIYLQGTQIDCVQEGLNEFIKFNNPNVKSACGCGESFSTEK